MIMVISLADKLNVMQNSLNYTDTDICACMKGLIAPQNVL